MLPVVAVGSVVLAGLAIAAPLFVYVGSLAAFGLAHVVMELRYVDQRFSARLGRGTLRGVLALLGVVVALRILGFVPGTSAWPLRELELGAVACLAAIAALPCVRRGEPLSAALAVAVTSALALGLALAPATTLVVLAFLHNLTPVGFVAERLRGAARRRALAACAFAFGVVPLFLASGLFGASAATFTPFPVGAIEAHLPVFVPRPWLDEPFAIRRFAVAAYLQCVHYAVVIGVLPRLGASDDGTRREPIVPWPRGTRLAMVLCVASALALVGFARDFADSRRVYGIASAIHAWSEVPVLLLAVSAGFRSAPTLRASPAPA